LAGENGLLEQILASLNADKAVVDFDDADQRLRIARTSSIVR